VAHRLANGSVEDVSINSVEVGNAILVRAGEIIPVDGLVTSAVAILDEAALTGEPIPVNRRRGEGARSGALNAGDTFEMRASATADDSTYAGIVRLVTTAQTAKSPFIRLADRYALLLLPVTLIIAGAAWVLSGDPIRGLAVLVAATPCPLILAAPVAFISGVSQAAKNGILIKGGGPLEALARAQTVMFDKTGTLTTGGARLIAVEVAPGEQPRGGVASSRLTRAGLPSCGGISHRRGGTGERSHPGIAGEGSGNHGVGTGRSRWRENSVRRLLSIGLRRAQARGLGSPSLAPASWRQRSASSSPWTGAQSAPFSSAMS
jgi:high-affinity K+ transport system ATPase subunit B